MSKRSSLDDEKVIRKECVKANILEGKKRM
jgi:hypothetical protein